MSRSEMGGASMRILILWADNRSANLGVRALAEGTETIAAQVWPTASFQTHNFGSRATPLPVGSVRSLTRQLALGSRGQLIPWLSQFDIVIDTRSGDSFSDVYGLRRLLIMNLMAEAARRAGCRVILGPQTIGPFKTWRGRQLGKRALTSADLVLARDTLSAGVATRSGRPVDAIVTDVVFALPIPPAGEPRDVVMNVSGLLWSGSPHVDPTKYRTTVLDLIDALQTTGRDVTLLAHVLANRTTDDDVAVLDQVRARLSNDIETVVPANLTDVRRTLAGARVTIGSRMHACLNSLSVGVPAIPLAYSQKFAPLLSDLGWQHNVDLRTSTAPVAEVMTALDADLGKDLAATLTAAGAARTTTVEALTNWSEVSTRDG